MKSIKYLLLGMFFLCPVFVFSNTILVPTQYATIQEAINVAQNGDTILVADGIYEGEINFNGYVADSVIIKSESGPENCIIQGDGSTIGFIFNSEDCKSTVEGFTIKNAMMGIWAYAGSSPTIKNNVIESCVTGINCSSEAKPIITSNIIKNCTNNGGGYSQYGGGISMSYSSATVINNQIINNSAAKGGGIYCENSTASLINNTIVGNSGYGISTSGGNDDPILRCEYDNYNRISECFVPLPGSENGLGGGVYLENSSPDIVNNIVAFSKGSQEATEPSSGLTRWYNSSLFMRYNYEEGKLKSVTYYYGFKNNGETGDLHLYNNQKHGSVSSIDTTFTIQSGECYWIETNSWVSPTRDYGGLNLVAHIDDDSIGVNVTIDNPMFSGCYYLLDTKIQSQGIVEGETGGAGIIAIGNSSFPNILYNDMYENGGGNYLVGVTSDIAVLVDLTGIDGNISDDPLLDSLTYELQNGSPCIDAGINDTTGLNIGDTDFNGNPRFFDASANRPAIIDIGAFEFQDVLVGIEDDISVKQEDDLYYTIFPNPNKGVFNFRINSNPPEELTVKLLNNVGQVQFLKSFKFPVTNQIEQFDVSLLSKGIYHFVITTDSSRKSKKIVIQ